MSGLVDKITTYVVSETSKMYQINIINIKLYIYVYRIFLGEKF